MQQQHENRHNEQHSGSGSSSEDDGRSTVRRKKNCTYQKDVRAGQQVHPVERARQTEHKEPVRHAQLARRAQPAALAGQGHPAPQTPARRSSRARALRKFLQVGHQGQSYNYSQCASSISSDDEVFHDIASVSSEDDLLGRREGGEEEEEEEHET